MPPGRLAPWHSWSAPLSLTWLAFEVLRCRPLSIPSKVFSGQASKAILLATHYFLPIDNLDLSHNYFLGAHSRPRIRSTLAWEHKDQLSLSGQSYGKSYRSKFSIGI